MDSRELEEYHNHRLFVRGKILSAAFSEVQQLELVILTIDANDSDLRFCGVTCTVELEDGALTKWVKPLTLWTDKDHQIKGSEFHERMDAIFQQPELHITRYFTAEVRRQWLMMVKRFSGMYCSTAISRGGVWLQMFGLMNVLLVEITAQRYVVGTGSKQPDYETARPLTTRIKGWIQEQTRDHCGRYGMF